MILICIHDCMIVYRFQRDSLHIMKWKEESAEDVYNKVKIEDFKIGFVCIVKSLFTSKNMLFG